MAQEDGSWPTRDDCGLAYTRFHAVACAVSALYAPIFRGFGPASAAQTDLLQAWAQQEPSRESKGASQAACGLKMASAAAMTQLQQSYADYRDQADQAYALEEAAIRRLCGLLKWKANDQQNTASLFEPASHNATSGARPSTTTPPTRATQPDADSGDPAAHEAARLGS